MKVGRLVVTAAAASVLLVGSAPAHAARQKLTTVQAPSIAGPTNAGVFSSPSERRRVRSGELIVRFKSGTSGSQRAAIDSKKGAKSVRFLGLSRTYLVRFDEHKNVDAQERSYERESAVEEASPNYVRHLNSTFPADTNLAELWGLHNSGQTANAVSGTADADIDAPEAWDATTGSSQVVIGVVDTGMDYANPDLAANVWANPGETGAGKETNGLDDDSNGKTDDHRGYDFLDTDNNPLDEPSQGHGTYMSGVIGAQGNNTLGTAGVTWNSRLAPLRACSPDPLVGCPDSALIQAFTYAGQMNMKIVNASLSGPGDNPLVSAAISTYPGTMFVVSAGNGGSDFVGDDNDSTPEYPCAYSPSNIVCVAATNQDDELAPFSDYGATAVDLAAPGTNILGPWLGNQLAYLGGTSPATGLVSGAAALGLARDPTRTTAQLKSDLLTNVDPKPTLSGKTVSGGRLNVNATVPDLPLPPPPGVEDSGFDGDGEVTTDFGSAQDEANAVAIQSDGKVVAAGGNNGDFALARYNSDGSLDTSFDGDGKVTTHFVNTDVGNAIAIQTDGRIVVGGAADVGSGLGADFAIARYNANGSLDTSFDSDGKRVHDLNAVCGCATTTEDSLNGLALQPDGRIVAVGDLLMSHGPTGAAAVRYNANGSFDTGFSGDGHFFAGEGFTAAAVRVGVLNKIIVAGSFGTGASRDLAVARFNTDGTLDTTFSGDGFNTVDFGQEDFGTALGIQFASTGNIVVAGASRPIGPAKLAFTTNRHGGEGDLYSSNVDGSAEARLTTLGGSWQDWSASTTGPQIAFQTMRDGNWEIYKMNPDGSAQTRLTNNSAIDSTPDWSPDGQQIVFESNRDGNGEIYKMNADGSTQTRLTTNPASDRQVVWSPDGRKIAFVSSRDGNDEIYVMNADGTGQTNLTNTSGSGEERPTWAADGGHIAFQTNADGDIEIHKMAASGGGRVNLTNSPGSDEFDPSWSPDNQMIAFTSNRTGFDVYTMTANGSGQSRVTTNAANDVAPDWQIRSNFALARLLDSNGALDTTFGTSGKAITRFTGEADVGGIALRQAPGTSTMDIIAAGSLASGINTVLARYNPNGAIYNRFGNDGRVYGYLAGNDSINAVALESDGDIVVAGKSGSDFALARYSGTAATVRVSPSSELANGQSVTVTGSNFLPGEQVNINQCRRSPNQCASGVSVTADGNGDFIAFTSFSYGAPTAGACEDPNCYVRAVSSDAFRHAEAPISFKAPSSTVGAPSAGAISQAQAITLGQSVTDSALTTGVAGGAVPSGTVTFYVCGPTASPATCIGGTQVGSAKTLTPATGVTSSATSDSFTPLAIGRYCFRAVYAGNDRYRSSTDSSKGQCIFVDQPTAAIEATEDYFWLPVDTTTYIVPAARGVLWNDHKPEGETLTATLISPPQNGDLVPGPGNPTGLRPDGSFTYTPDPGFTGPDTFTYQAQGPSGTASGQVTLVVTAANDTDANRSRANRSRANRSRTLDAAQVVTYADCRSRYVSVNPQVTLSEDTFIQLSAALYDAAGQRIAAPEGYLAYGDFFADFTNPLTLAWPLWSEPAPAGGAYAQVVLEAFPGTPDAYTLTATVPCRT